VDIRKDLQDAWDQCPDYKDILGKTTPLPDEIESFLGNEEVLHILRGTWVHKVTHRNRIELAVFVLTNKMIHIIGKNEILTSRSKSNDAIPLHTITSISSFTRKTMTGTNVVVELKRANASDVLQMTKKFIDHADAFVRLTKDAILNANQDTENKSSNHDSLKTLEKLKNLLDLNVITQQEFDEKKEVILKNL